MVSGSSGMKHRTGSPQQAPTRPPAVCTEQGLLSGHLVSTSLARSPAVQGSSDIPGHQWLCWACRPHLGLAPPVALVVAFILLAY